MKKNKTIFIFIASLFLSFGAGMYIQGKISSNEKEEIVAEADKNMSDLYWSATKGDNQIISSYPDYVEKELSENEKDRLVSLLANYLNISSDEVEKKLTTKNINNKLPAYVTISNEVDFETAKQLNDILNSDETLKSFVSFSNNK